MAIDLSAFENSIHEAIQFFWESRDKAKERQSKRGVSDRGNRSSVTTGKNLDGFIHLIRQTIIDNGLSTSSIYTNGRINLTIPGFYRPTKNWDLLIVQEKKLVAAIELKSQVGPSFGNNFNNRVEEAIGNAVDLNTAFREGAFGESKKPFVGYLFILEDCIDSNSSVNYHSPHFPVFDEFIDASYSTRYDLFCRKLIQEQLYDAASLILTKKNTNTYSSRSGLTNIKTFFVTLASKITEIAALAEH